ELVGGTRAAAWPLIRHDLSLDYAAVGLVLAIPGFVGSALDPLIGAAGDTSCRRALLLVGGVALAVSTALSAGALGFWTALAALRRRDVMHRLALLEASDLLIDVFHGFLALYLVDVARLDVRTAALGVAVWTGAGLIGDALVLAVLRRIEGARYLRWSAAL